MLYIMYLNYINFNIIMVSPFYITYLTWDQFL